MELFKRYIFLHHRVRRPLRPLRHYFCMYVSLFILCEVITRFCFCLECPNHRSNHQHSTHRHHKHLKKFKRTVTVHIFGLWSCPHRHWDSKGRRYFWALRLPSQRRQTQLSHVHESLSHSLNILWLRRRTMALLARDL